MKKITKTIELKVERDDKYIICEDLAALYYVVGSQAISGNFKIYKIKKVNGLYKVPVSFIKERIKILESRICKLSNYLSIMKKVVK